MSRQAIVGLFTILGLIALFMVYFVLSDLATRASGYEIGVHFPSASGLTRGAIVYESGVQVGTVSQIKLLDDFSVDLILSIKNNVDIPRDSQFVISAPLTGSSTLTIVPPRISKEKVALLPREILPLDQQPKGSNPVSVSDLLQAGQGELVKLDALLSDLQKREPVLMSQLQSAITNANELAVTANGLVQRFSKQGDEIVATLHRSLDVASANIVDLTEQLDQTLRTNTVRVDALMASLNRTASSLAVTTNSLQQLATNPEVHNNLIETTRQIANATTNIAGLTNDLRTITGDPNTQAQLKDTLANTDAVMQKVNSLLGALGGTSAVHGVDAGAPAASATPAASSGGGRIVPASPAPAVPTPAPMATRSGEVRLSRQLRDRIGQVARNLVEVQIRITGLSKQTASVPNNALLNSNTGPQGDFNLRFLPHGDYQLFTGVNDVSQNQTWNFALEQKMGQHSYLGGGLLYSRLGLLGGISQGAFGFEARAYGIPGAYLDAYLHLHATKTISLFGGERDILHKSRRTVYGVQLDFLGGR